jgi:hypothetical protein
MPNHNPFASFMWSLFYSAFLLSSFALGRNTVAAAATACGSCENGGTCRPNSPNCACPIGWTGATCDQPYESCFNIDQTSKCLNGGKCLNGELDDFGNVQNYCACDSTHTGKYCQHTVLPMEEGCTVANQAKFCFNGGACNPGYYPYVSYIVFFVRIELASSPRWSHVERGMMIDHGKRCIPD